MEASPRPTDPDERSRIRSALIALVAEHGYLETSLEAVLERAGVDRAAFARHYENLDACFAEIWEDYKEQFLRVTVERFASSEDWREGLRGAAWAFCRFLQEDRDRARFFVIEVIFGGEPARARLNLLMTRYAELIARGNEGRRDPPLPLAQAEAVIGAIFELIGAQIKAGDLESLEEYVPQGLYLTVYPYLGLEAAKEELQRGREDMVRYRRGEI